MSVLDDKLVESLESEKLKDKYHYLKKKMGEFSSNLEDLAKQIAYREPNYLRTYLLGVEEVLDHCGKYNANSAIIGIHHRWQVEREQLPHLIHSLLAPEDCNPNYLKEIHGDVRKL